MSDKKGISVTGDKPAQWGFHLSIDDAMYFYAVFIWYGRAWQWQICKPLTIDLIGDWRP